MTESLVILFDLIGTIAFAIGFLFSMFTRLIGR